MGVFLFSWAHALLKGAIITKKYKTSFQDKEDVIQGR